MLTLPGASFVFGALLSLDCLYQRPKSFLQPLSAAPWAREASARLSIVFSEACTTYIIYINIPRLSQLLGMAADTYRTTDECSRMRLAGGIFGINRS